MAVEPDAPRRLRVVVLALPAGVAPDRLAALVSRHVALPCVLDTRPPAPNCLELPGRNQCDARALLDWLDTGREAHEWVLGLTGHDVSLPIFSHVFGLARQGGGTALVSLARLDPAFDGLPADARLWCARIRAEALHELGHVAGLTHCHAPSCVMRFAATVSKADARGAAFCATCHAHLPTWLRRAPSGSPAEALVAPG